MQKYLNRAKNIFFLCAVYLMVPIRGTAKHDGNNASKFVLVYPTKNIGDMVCITPLLYAIKKNKKEAHITVVGSERNKELLMHNSYVDAYIVIPSSSLYLAWMLRKKRFDAGIVISMDALHFSALFLAGIKSISCHVFAPSTRFHAARPYIMMSKLAHVTVYTPGAYVPLQHMGLLHPFNIYETETIKCLGSSVESDEMVLETFSHMKIKNPVVIAPGAGAVYKQWPPERFALIGNYIYKKYKNPIIFLGGAQDRNAIESVIRNIEPDVQYWDPGPLNMDMLKSVLKKSICVVGNDSGAIHVGEAFGTPTITIAGVTDVFEHMQRGPGRHIITAHTDIRVFYQAYVVDELLLDTSLALKQMEKVTVDMVQSVIDHVLYSG